MTRLRRPWIALTVVAATAAVTLAGQAPAAGGPWWDVEPEAENPSPFYDSILYSEIGPRLREIETNSNRVRVEVAGQSAGGRDMYVAVVAAPEEMGRLGQYKAIRQTMLRDPAAAQAQIEKFGDFKVPVFVNGSIHGNEYPGTDAAIRLIETLAYDDSPEVREILENVILVVNVVQNPDGRVLGTRQNANGFDLNRDFFAQTQPETKVTVDLLTEWNPMSTLDLHGFVNPMLIEPTTPPHNPNYEYDLYLKWALEEAYAMEDELFAQLGLPAIIPYRDFSAGWDDWSSQYVPMFAMYHGSYGHTLETPSRDELGVDAHYAAVWGALNFIAANREAMLHDQIEIFRRGALDLPQMLIPDELLDETQYEQYNELTIQEFPVAHVLPVGPQQESAQQVARLVDFLLDNDVQVEQATGDFVIDGTTYPAGSYVVWMDQPKRGLANMFLGDGADLSDVQGLTFYSPPATWSHPLLWGATRIVATDDVDVSTRPISKADRVAGSVTGNRAAAYAYESTSLTAITTTNELIDAGVEVRRAPESFVAGGRTFEPGTFIVPADRSLANRLANDHGLDVYALTTVPDSVVLEMPRIAVFGDEGTRHALGVLGFDFVQVGTGDINSGAVEDFDVFVNDGRSWTGLQNAGRASLTSFFDAGGDYVGFRNNGVRLGVDAGIVDAVYDFESGNAIVDVEYSDTAGAAAGFPDDDEAFVLTPTWFTSIGSDVEVVATMGTGDFLISGYWPASDASGAAGRPLAVQDSEGDRDATVFGMDLTFRGHPENMFRLLANAIYETAG